MGDPVKRHRIEVIDRTYAAILAAKTPAERVAMASEMHETAREVIQRVVLQLHPDWSEEARHREFLRRLLGHAADQIPESRG